LAFWYSWSSGIVAKSVEPLADPDAAFPLPPPPFEPALELELQPATSRIDAVTAMVSGVDFRIPDLPMSEPHLCVGLCGRRGAPAFSFEMHVPFARETCQGKKRNKADP
jgi:hypothetical protein